MSIHLPPSTRQPLLTAIRKKQPKPGQVRLSDHPDLALAASVTTAPLAAESQTFAAVMASLETLARLKLSVSSAWLLMLLVKHGPQSCVMLCARMKISSPAMTGLVTRLEMLALIGVQRGTAPDRRAVTITATEAARKVLASVMTLTELGTAAAMLLEQRATSHPARA